MSSEVCIRPVACKGGWTGYRP